jgi:hypothetical protein
VTIVRRCKTDPPVAAEAHDGEVPAEQCGGYMLTPAHQLVIGVGDGTGRVRLGVGLGFGTHAISS